jgi:hypothetical protein
MKIEATAVKMVNDTINKKLTPTIFKLRQIEVFRALSNSNNSKLILTDKIESLEERFINQ